MAHSPLTFQVEKAQANCFQILQRASHLSPAHQDRVAAELDQFNRRISQILGNQEDQPECASVPDGTEKKKAVDLFFENRYQVGQLLGGAHAGIFYKDLIENTSTWSPELHDLLGVAPDEKVGPNHFMGMIHPDDRPYMETSTQAAIERGGPFYEEFRLVRPNGETAWMSAVGFVQHDPEGRPVSMVGINQDITQRKQAEEALRESETQLRESEKQARQRLNEIETIYRTAPIALCAFDNHLRWVRLNPALAEINGVPLEDHLGKTLREVVPDLGDQAEEALRIIMETGRPLLDFEMSGKTAAQPDLIRYWKERWVPIKDDQGTVLGISVAAEEITERKRAEAEREQLLQTIRAQNELFVRILRDAPIGIAVVNTPEFRYELVNEYYRRGTAGMRARTGLTAAEVWGSAGTPLLKALEKAYLSGAIVQQADVSFPVERAPGQVEDDFFTFSFLPLKNPAGAVDRVMILMQETTQQVRALQAIEASQNLMKAVIDNAPEGIVVADHEGRIVLSNALAERLYSRPIPYQEPFAVHSTLQVCYPDGTPYEARDLPLTRSALDGETFTNLEMAIRWPDGQLRLILANTGPIRDHQGQVTGAVGIFQDITNFKQTQALLVDRDEALRKSHEQIVQILENMTDGFFSVDREWRMKYVNQNAAEQGGHTPEELLGSVIWETSPQLKGSILETVYRKVMSESRPETIQYHSQYSGRWFELHVQPSPDGIAVYSMDITNRKQAEQALEEAHSNLIKERSRLLAVMEALPIGLAIYDEIGGVIQANSGYEAVWGSPRPPADSVDDYELYKAWWVETGERVKPEEWAAAQAVQKCTIVTGQYLRIQKFDGSDGYVLNSGAPVRDAQGQVIGATVAIMDITQRVQAENSLHESEERFRVAISYLPMMVYSMDRDLRYTRIYNPRLGLAPQQVIGKRDDELVPPEAAAEIIAIKQSVIDTGERIQKEVKSVVDGETRHYLLSLEPLLDYTGAVAGLIGASLDITEPRRVENERQNALTQMEIQRQLLENREKERQEIARELHDGPIQLLSGAMFNLQVVKEILKDPSLSLELGQAALSLKVAIRELRDTVNELRPPTIIRFGFTKVARMHVEDLKEKYPDLKFDLDLFEDGNLFPETIRLALYRIFQESLNNAIKHAHASQIFVRFSMDDQQVFLQIDDNGQGFLIPGDLIRQTQRGRYGLAGMKERAEAIGGCFMITSEPEQGTHVLVTLPLPEKD